jgi:hypothetical protein
MKLDISSFRGEIPRLTPRALPPNMAQEATNCRLETGDLTPFRQFVAVKTLAAAAQTIYKLNGSWLSWNAQVDVARGLIPGDTNFFTFLTSPGLYSTPRYTTYSLATTGSEPFPVTTNPLGMPAPTAAPGAVPGVDPTPTTFSVDVTDAGNELGTSWTTSAAFNEYNHTGFVSEVAGTGNPAPSYDVNCENNNSECAYAFRNFGIAAAAATQVEAQFSISVTQGDNGIVVTLGAGLDIAGGGLRVGVYSDIGAPVLAIQTGTSWNVDSVLSSVAVGSGLTRGVWYTLIAAVIKNADGTLAVTATLKNGGTTLQTLSATVSTTWGDYCAIIGRTGDDRKHTFFDNIHVTASGATGATIVTTATSYVYTFLNDNVGGTGVDWESAPSPASATVLKPDGVKVTVTTATSHGYDSGYGINKKRIYRAVSGATGDIFLLVAEIPLATATYDDVSDDSEISNPGTPLESEDWDLPPATLQGIIALPNNCMVGFFANQLCFSEVGRPHAWPVKYRLTTDTDIVAISNIDNTIVLGTKAFVYVATGNDPATYAMSKPGAAQACVSKLSMTYLDNFGVVFASPDGFQVCAGSAANVANATAKVFTKQQWEALTPSSIRSAIYDGVLYFWFTGSTPDAGYALDTKADGFGLIRLSHHAAAAHVDPLTDSLFVILDVNSEPTDVDLPVASTAVATSTTIIYQWDASGSSNIVYRWRGKLNLLPYPTTLHFAKVEGQDFTNVLSRVYADGALLHEKVAANPNPYRIPGLTTYATYESEIMGTSRIRTHQIASTVAELD